MLIPHLVLVKNVKKNYNFINSLSHFQCSLHNNDEKKRVNSKEIILTSGTEESVPQQLTALLEADAHEQWGETFISFENGNGKGSIKTITFNWGITFTNWEVTFSEQTLLKLHFDDKTPIDFIFVNKGHVEFHTDTLPETKLNSFQNIIIRYKPNSDNTFTFKKDQKVEITFIQIWPEKYQDKKNHNVEYLNERIKKLFDDSMNELYNHFGNYNLRIADQINEINKNKHHGIVRTLTIEGHLNIILGLQLLEHDNFLNLVSLPENLTQSDVEKIQKACDLIKENISEKITVAALARKVLMPQSKLQLGFQILHNQTVNEYIKEIKLIKACEYLKNDKYTVSEIVYKIGFNSRSYFSRIFTERFGMLPTKYRKNLK